jgi:hypothetical protein
MTKEQFLSGTPFTVDSKTYKGASTFYYNNDPGCICKQSRSSIDERVVIDEYECTVTKISRTRFTGFTYVIKKKVTVNYKFGDLVPYIPETSVGE